MKTTRSHRDRNFSPLRDKTLANVLRHLFITEFGYENKALFAEAMEERDIFWVRINQRGRSRGRIGEVTLYYNRYFHPQPGESYSVTLHPDYVIEMPDGRRYVFDAKYKYTSPAQFMDHDLLAVEEAQERVALTYKKADLYKMHTYRDALDAHAVFILYPGTVFSAFGVNQQRYDNAAALPSDFAGVGALPLAPGQYEILAHVLRKFLLS